MLVPLFDNRPTVSGVLEFQFPYPIVELSPNNLALRASGDHFVELTVGIGDLIVRKDRKTFSLFVIAVAIFAPSGIVKFTEQLRVSHPLVNYVNVDRIRMNDGLEDSHFGVRAKIVDPREVCQRIRDLAFVKAYRD